MQGYLGSKVVAAKDSPFANYTATDYAMHFIEAYGQIDGSHHKTWVLDQVARILKGTPVVIHRREWSPNPDHPNGLVEHELTTGDPSTAYEEWVQDMLGAYDEENEEHEYTYDEGIAP